MNGRLNDNKTLMAEYDYEKNNGLNPNDILEGSGKEVWWKCSKCGYSWKKRIVDRFKGKGCPVCANRITVPGINDLYTVYPNVAEEWDYELNEDNPHNINCHSLKKEHWICSKGHRWECSVNSRTYGNSGCPVCANLKIVEGYNDLASRCPRLASEWDYDLNDKKPTDVGYYSTYKAHWICKFGHKWVATVESRYRGNDCPKCVKGLKISFPEKAILFYIKKIFKNVIENYKPDFLGNKELDIYIPSIKVGIEYDGVFWHNNKSKDFEKDKLCYENGVTLYRVREQGCEDYNSPSKKIYLKSNNSFGLDNAIDTLIKMISNRKTIIDTKADQVDIEQLIERNKTEKSVSELYPKISKMWDIEKNGLLRPENYGINSHLEVYWLCPKCHNSFKREIRSMISKNGSCPICLNQVIVSGVNDFATKYPRFLSEWDFDKNREISPYEINMNGDKPVWWLCPKGHSYQQTIYSKVKNGSGCPYCSGRYPIKGKNDLLIINPIFMLDWNYDKNKGLDPSNYSLGSSKKVWWKCHNCGYVWLASIKSRKRGNGCFKCGVIKRAKERSKKVYQYDENNNLVKVYNSATMAEKLTNIKHITSVCRGERPRAGGYKWTYEEIKSTTQKD